MNSIVNMDKSVTKSVLGLEAPRIQQLPNITDSGLSMLGSDKFKDTEYCIICRQIHKSLKSKPNHCRLCGGQACLECSRKRINGEVVCDLCFLKQELKKGESRRKEMLRQKEAAVEEIQAEIERT
jgi:hypothetical protein